MTRSLGTAVAAVALAVLVGCSSPSGSDSQNSNGGGTASVPEPAAPGDPEGAHAGATDADAERQIVTTATASVAVKDPRDGAQQVSELAEAAGGRVDERSEQAGSGKDGLEGAAADLVVRVPADALTGVLADLEGLGDVASVSVSRSDVTTTAIDLDARISALQTSVTRLQSLMDGAATTEALLADQVELSTLRVHLQPFGVSPAGGPDGFLDGLGTGWRALVSALSAAVVVLGVLLPWMVVAALVATAVLVPIRLARRRSAVKAPVPPVPPQG